MKKAIDFLSSRRVSVYLFLVLLFVSLLGAFIPQKELPAYYEAHYRAWAVTLLEAFQLTDVYHAWYFILLLAYLVVSLTTCTLRRLPRVLGVLRRRPPAPTSPDGLALQAELGPAAAAPALEEAARRLPFRWGRVGDVLYGRRRPYALWGEVLTHAGLAVILVAAFFRLFGHRDAVFIFEGQGVVLPPAYGVGYELWADEVKEIRDADSGHILEYRTRARLLREGEEVAAAAVEVNGPLRYGGFGIYQSNMDVAGATGAAVEAVKLAPDEDAGGRSRRERGRRRRARRDGAPRRDGFRPLLPRLLRTFRNGRVRLPRRQPRAESGGVLERRRPRGRRGDGDNLRVVSRVLDYPLVGRDLCGNAGDDNFRVARRTARRGEPARIPGGRRGERRRRRRGGRDGDFAGGRRGSRPRRYGVDGSVHAAGFR